MSSARLISHQACQWPSRFARANLPAMEDDSHSNLGWLASSQALVSKPVEARFQVGFSFSLASLLWLVDGQVANMLPLQGESESTIGLWLASLTESNALQDAREVTLPYELEAADYDIAGCQNELSQLGHWFSLGDTVLSQTAEMFSSAAVNDVSVRCWPHHFDIACLLFLENGDPETARSIGIGLSPGDGSYGTPYFYCSPWPAPAELPAVEAPLKWHREGFTSLVLTAPSLDTPETTQALIQSAVTTCVNLLK